MYILLFLQGDYRLKKKNECISNDLKIDYIVIN